MLSKEEVRLALVIVICSAILVSSCVYIFVFASEKTTFFQLSLTGPDGAILAPELNVASNENCSMLLTVQNSMGNNEQCRLDAELSILNSTGNLVNSTALNGYTFSINQNGTWNQTFTCQINNSTNDNVNIITFDNTSFSAGQYNENLIFQFRFDLWAYNDTIGTYSYTNTWVSSPFLDPTS